jgi:anti-sigma regulatory factor (Ser/Thr protein kinase)
MGQASPSQDRGDLVNPSARTRYVPPSGWQHRRARRHLLPLPGGAIPELHPDTGDHPDAAHPAPGAPPELTPHEQVLVGGPFTRVDLRRVRQRIHELAHRWRLPEPVGLALELVTTELVVNVVLHAGGQGRLRLSRYPGWLFCQVSDTGSGLARPCVAGWQPPSATQPSGRGLWIARCFSERLTIDSSPLGTTVTAKIAAPEPPAR